MAYMLSNNEKMSIADYAWHKNSYQVMEDKNEEIVNNYIFVFCSINKLWPENY